MGEIKRRERKLVRQGSILDVYEDTMELADGSVEKWDFVHHRMGAAAVVPILPDGRILLVRQYRPALERYTWELPAGSRDSTDEPTEVTARRELLEETGYAPADMMRLLSLKTTVAFTDEMVDVYLARDIYFVGEQKPDPAEDIVIRAWRPNILLDWIYSGRLQDAKTVAGILAWHTFFDEK